MRSQFLNHARAAIVGAMCLGASMATAGTVTVHVPADQPTIQAAIDVAEHGDEIVVAPGTYNEKINLLGKMIILRSEQGPAETIIDAKGPGGSAVTMNSGESMFTILDGFTITGGTGVLVGSDRLGGGLYVANASPSIMNCIVTGNGAARGGGAYIGSGGAPWIMDSVFIGNSATKSGGALYNALSKNGSAAVGPVIVETLFEGNTAPDGAAVDNRATLSFFGSQFAKNAATQSSGAAVTTSGGLMLSVATFEGTTGRALKIQAGGGAAIMDSHFENNSSGAITAVATELWQNLHIERTTFRGNSAANGGAIRSEGKILLTVIDSTFEDNIASGAGGAIHTLCAIADQPICPDVEILESTFTGNSALSHGGAVATGCATAGGVADCAAIVITDSVLSGNEAGGYGGALHNRCVQWIDAGSGDLNTYCGEIVVLRSTLAQNAAGQGGGAIANLDESVSVVGDSLLCQNVPEHVFGEWEDQGGNEVTALPDLNCDGAVNVFDMLELLAAWGQCEDSVSGTCPADLDGDGAVNVFDLLIMLAKWG